MHFGFLKWILVLAITAYPIIAVAQPEEVVYWENASQNIEDSALDLNSLTTYYTILDASTDYLCSNSCLPKSYMGITHLPSVDFNIYLAYHQAVTPKIRTSFEVSLNYAGVMNIKGLFLLRKRR